MKKSLLFVMIALLLLSVWPLSLSSSANASVAAEDSGEVVMLIDVSGSMNKADPDRVSIKAASMFAGLVSSEAGSFKLSVVLYHTDVHVAINGMDVSRDDEKQKFRETLDTIEKLPQKGKYEGFPCWTKDTDIGKAMKEAEKILSKSSAANKAVILFTDGKIDLDNNFSVTTKAEQTSIDNSYSSANAFGKNGTPVYAVGLNHNNGVDKKFLQEMADLTNGKFYCCTSSAELVDPFWDIYTSLGGGTLLKQDPIKLPAGKTVTCEVEIYGQAIREVNLVLFSSSVIDSYTVTNPKGTVVAQRKANGSESSSGGCLMDYDDYAVRARLVTPTDGKWQISFSSKEGGTVRFGEIYMYNLRVEGNAKDTAVVGDTVSFSPVLINADTDSRVTTSAIYQDSTCTVSVSNADINDIYTAKLNDSKNGYTLKIPFNTPGEYQITYQIDNDRFKAESTETITVLPPKLVLSTDKTACQPGETVKVICKLENPNTGAEMNVPAYLDDFDLFATVKLDGKEISSRQVNYSDNGEISFTYQTEKAGSFEVSVSMRRYNDSIESAAPAKFTAWEPKLVVSGGKNKIGCGDTVDLKVALQNPITSTDIELPDYLKNGTMTAEIKWNGQVIDTVTVDVQTGKFSFVPVRMGAYEVTVKLTAKDVTISTEKALTFAVEPIGISISTDNYQTDFSITDGNIAFGIVMQHPDGTILTDCPDFMKDYTIIFTCNGESSKAVTLAEFFAGGGKYSFTPAKAGEYTMTAIIEGGADKFSEKRECNIKIRVKASSITMEEDGLKDIQESTLAGTVEQEIDLNEIFKDSDKDKLTFKVEADNDNISIDVEDGVLRVTVKSGTTGTVTVKVSDGKGAEYTATFEVEVKSLMPLLIGIIVAVIAVIVGIVIFLIVVKKRSVINMVYRIKLTVNGDSAVYKIARASGVHNAKPEMTVKEVLTLRGLATYDHGDLSDEEIERVINQHCGKVKVAGMPFKKGFKVIPPDGVVKVFDSYVVKVNIKTDDDDEEISISFGKNSDFVDSSDF